MPWDSQRPRARQGDRLPTALRRKVIKHARENNLGCFFMFLDICTGLDGVIEVHHIREVEDTGVPDNSMENLAAACKPCHTRFSARQAQKRAVRAGNEWKRKPEKHPGVLD